MKVSGTIAVIFGILLIFSPQAAGVWAIILGTIVLLAGAIKTK